MQVKASFHVYFAMSVEVHTNIQTHNKQQITIQNKKQKSDQSISNLTCSTETGIMSKNLTLQNTNSVSSIT